MSSSPSKAGVPLALRISPDEFTATASCNKNRKFPLRSTMFSVFGLRPVLCGFPENMQYPLELMTHEYLSSGRPPGFGGFGEIG